MLKFIVINILHIKSRIGGQNSFYKYFIIMINPIGGQNSFYNNDNPSS